MEHEDVVRFPPLADFSLCLCVSVVAGSFTITSQLLWGRGRPAGPGEGVQNWMLQHTERPAAPIAQGRGGAVEQAGRNQHQPVRGYGRGGEGVCS